MNLINNTTFKTITTNHNGSNYSKLEYSSLSDALLLEITSKYYQIGVDEEDNPILVDLHLVTSFDDIITDNLFNDVTVLYFKDRDLAIIDYNNNLIDISFKRKKYHIEIPDFGKLLNDADFGNMAILTMNNTGIISPNAISYVDTNGDILLRKDIFLDHINDSDITKLEQAESANLLSININPIRND